MSTVTTLSKLPAHLEGKSSGNNPFAAAGGSGGMKTLSTKGGEFHVEEGNYRELLSDYSLDVVILSTNPNKSKVYYAEGYEEGGFSSPTCYTNNGTAPSEYASEPQSKKCAICPNNQWGSRITDRGGRGKACSDSMRLCVSTADNIDEPMLLKVTATALKTLGAYGAQLAKRGVDPMYVVTQLGFDETKEFPSLTFKAVRFIEEDELKTVDKVTKDEKSAIDKITGVADAPISEAGAFKTVPKKEKKAEKAPVKDEPKPEVAEKKKPKVEEYDNIEDALDNLDFDD